MKMFNSILFVILIMTTVNLRANDFSPLKVGILIYDGVYLLDFCGPLEVFNDTFIDDTTKGFEVFLIAPSEQSITAHTGTSIKPDYNIINCPNLDILIVPGGNLRLTKENPEISEFIINKNKSTQITMSVCTGAFILADLGLLNNLEATTWYGAKSRLKKLYPEILLTDKRFTDNGKIITTAGISAGIDGSFHVVERIYGKEIAQKTREYIEWE
jgi:transcriptional regulator GlxA family with amidase domain